MDEGYSGVPLPGGGARIEPPPVYTPKRLYTPPAAQPAMSPAGSPRPPPGPASPAAGYTGLPPSGIFAKPGRSGVPEPVAIAFTLLAVFAAVGIVVALMMASVRHDVGLDVTSSGGMFEFFYGGSGALGAVLVVLLRRGSQPARMVTTLLSAAWALYWLFELASTNDGSSPISAFGAAGVIVVLSGLTVVAACALIAVLPWTSSAREHFAKR